MYATHNMQIPKKEAIPSSQKLMSTNSSWLTKQDEGRERTSALTL